MPRMAHGKRLRSGRHSESGRIYHLTLACWCRRHHFRDMSSGRAAVFGMRCVADQAETLCFVVMPDHVHWLVQLTGSMELFAVVQKMKSVATRAWRQASCEDVPLWQKGFYDRALRREEDLLALARYMIANPLRAGLVSSVRQYPLWDCVWL